MCIVVDITFVILCHNSATRMATSDHCMFCKKSFKMLLHHLSQSSACKSHYMAIEKAAAAVPDIVSNEGHVNVGNVSQSATHRPPRPNLRSSSSHGLLPELESGGIVGKADDDLVFEGVEDVDEVADDFVFDDDAISEGDADEQDISETELEEGPDLSVLDLFLETVQAASKSTWSCMFFSGGEGPN